MKIELLKSAVSTNESIKRYLPLREDVFVCAERQTGGKGTKGRSFLSEVGGVYLSALTFPEALPAREAFRVMAHAAVAVCRTVERFGAVPAVKWANDVLVGGKKICGILVENSLSGEFIDHSIVGIGLNVTNDVSALGGIATSLCECVSAVPSVEEVREELIRSYLRKSTFEEYLSRVGFLGERVQISEGGRVFSAVARAVLPDGRLEIEEDGAVRRLSSAEIKLIL